MTKSLLTILSVTLLLLGAAGFALAHSGHMQFLSVQSDSMAPAVRPGDLVIVEPITIRELRSGDIISYRSPVQPNLTITHRVVTINAQRRVVIAKGDKLTELDPYIPAAAVTGKVAGVVPRLGVAVQFLRTIPGLVVGCYIPASLVLLAEIQRYSRQTDTVYRRLVRAP